MENICINDLDTQSSTFQERKKLKQMQGKIKKRLSKRISVVKRHSVFENIANAGIYRYYLVNTGFSAEDNEQREIISQIMYLSEKKVKNQQLAMANEIEAFIEKNMCEMHKALDELKQSFEEEINSLDGNNVFNFRGSIWRGYTRT
jgi:hypothetical protein